MLTKLTLRSLMAHKARFFLATFAVVLGVGFVTGAFILTDSLRKTFDGLFTEINKGIDVQVRTKLAFGKPSDTARDPVAASLLPSIKQVDGVRYAGGSLFRAATMIDKKGKAITTKGAPMAAVSFDGLNPTSGVQLRAGRAPKGDAEAVIDKDTADNHSFALGDQITVVLPNGKQSFSIVGTIGQGKDSGFVGATIVGFDPEVAPALLDTKGTFDSIDVAGKPGVSNDALQVRVSKVLPAGIEAVTSETVTKDTKGGIDSFLTPFGNVLLGFAFVALFVSAFIINNTFAIIVGQRVRELALLRAIGSSASQIRRQIVGEALTVGALASVIGIGLGVLISRGIIALFDAAGGGFPKTSTVIGVRTLVFAVVVGIGVTLVSSLAPSRRAARIPPVAAMRADEAFNAMTLTGSRLVRGSIILLAGIILTGTGLFARPGGTAGIIGISSFGAILLFLGVASLSATVARPVTRVLGAPVERIFGTAGHLARENASRQPRRTASTASALMIGIALVSTFAVVGQSFKSTLNDVLHRSVKADYFVKTDSFQGFPAKFAAEVRAVPGIDAVSSFRQGKLQVNGDTKTIGAINPNTWAKLVDLNVQAGSVEALSNGGVLLQVDPAKSLNLRVGSKVAVTWPSGKQESLPVVGIYKDAGVVNTNWLVSIATLEAAGTGEQNDFFVAAKMTAGANSATVRAAIDKVALDFPQVTVQNRAEFQKGQEDQINQVLVIVNALLGLTVLIALLGIANTLALSVFERTRELGLMRAVGMSRRQLKRMVRWESVIVSVFGALLGIAVGVLLGAALANALPESLISTVAIPYGTLVTLVIVAIVSGMLAAAFPARRASKLDILGAIAAS